MQMDFDEALLIVSGVIFLTVLGIGLLLIGNYSIGSLMLVISAIWIISIYLFMGYIEKKDNESED